MATIRLGNLLWRNRTTPISQDDPLDTRDINSESIKTTLQQVQQLLSGVATEAKLEQARALLANLNAKDFATQATLAAVKSELALVKAELQEIKANQLSGDQKVQLSGTSTKVETIVDAVAITSSTSLYYGIPNYEQFTSRYPDIDFEITNTLDRDVWVAVITGLTGSSASAVMMEDGTFGVYLTAPDGVAHLVPAGVQRIMLSEIPATKRNTDLKALTKSPFKHLITPRAVAVRAFTAPTSGALTVRIVGRAR